MRMWQCAHLYGGFSLCVDLRWEKADLFICLFTIFCLHFVCMNNKLCPCRVQIEVARVLVAKGHGEPEVVCGRCEEVQ